MKRACSFFFFLFTLVVMMGMVSGCGCGDDDDDDDSDDAGDDDDTGADDDTGDDDAGFPCEDAYDVIVNGETDMGGGNTSIWTGKLVIEDNGDITGIIIPTTGDMGQYDVTGFRNDETTGYLDGSFPTPVDWAALCDQAAVYNHIDLTVIEDDMTGVVTFYCGAADGDLIGSAHDATGLVACGDFDA